MFSTRRSRWSARPARAALSTSRWIESAFSVCSTKCWTERVDVELTALQQDALIELLNIGFGRAAASLSQLTGHRVLLDVPQVTIHPVAEVAVSLGRVITADVASVHQIFP